MTTPSESRELVLVLDEGGDHLAGMLIPDLGGGADLLVVNRRLVTESAVKHVVAWANQERTARPSAVAFLDAADLISFENV